MRHMSSPSPNKTSAKRLAANRLNALRTTGPKTEAGKRRSAVNAIRHGLTVPISASPWAGQLPHVVALLLADGLSAPQAHSMALCILDFERNLQHQRNRYLHSLGHTNTGINPDAAGQTERELALALMANMPARGNFTVGVSREAAKSSARFLMKVASHKQRSAEQELRNADRHLRRAASQLVKQCRGLQPNATTE